MDGQCGDVGGADDTPDRQRRSELLATCVQLVAQEASPLGRAGGKAQLLDLWRTKIKNFEYQKLAGVVMMTEQALTLGVAILLLVLAARRSRPLPAPTPEPV